MAQKVEGKLYESLTGQLFEIGRQLRQKNGYPYNPDLLHKYLQAVIEGKFRGLSYGKIEEVPVVGRFLMTVKLGQYKTIYYLCYDLKAAGRKFKACDSQVIGKISLSVTMEEVELWEVCVAELGFTKAVPRKDIYERAIQLGFAVCPAEAIALARIKCGDDKRRFGGMEPIADSNGDPRILYLSDFCCGLWLFTHYDYPEYLWNPDQVWLFVRPRRK